jgi:hypothetical protein
MQRQTDRQTDKQTDRERERGRERETRTHTHWRPRRWYRWGKKKKMIERTLIEP